MNIPDEPYTTPRRHLAAAQIPHEGLWVMVKLKLPREDFRQIDRCANTSGMRVQGWMRRALRRALDAEGEQGTHLP